MRYKVMKGSLVLSGLWLSGCFAATAALAETRELTQDMPIQGYARLDIDAGPGALVVTGAAGDVVQARLTLQFPDDWTEAQVQEVLDDYLHFAFSSTGERLMLSANWDWNDDNRRDGDWPFSGWDDDEGVRIQEVTVQVPAGLELRIQDGSGDADISDLAANLDITDGSGSLRIVGLTGSLKVDDGSGELDIVDITGEVEVEDGSGQVNTRAIGGEVDIRD